MAEDAQMDVDARETTAGREAPEGLPKPRRDAAAPRPPP